MLRDWPGKGQMNSERGHIKGQVRAKHDGATISFQEAETLRVLKRTLQLSCFRV